MQIDFGFFDFFFSFFWVFFGLIFVIFIVVFVFAATKICQTGSRLSQGGWTIEAPSFVIPQGRTRSDGSEMKTVRLPDRCPS